MELLRHTFITVVLLSFLGAINVHAKGDTLSAMVMYGEKMLFEEVEELNRSEALHYRDSLAALPDASSNLIQQLDLYLSIPTMTFDEVFTVIDSLFELDTIPYPLINQINYFVAHHNFEENEGFDTSAYPASFYYPDWNTSIPNPYNSNELIASDTVINLQLTGSKLLEDYHHPYSGKITSKFGWRDGRNHNGVDIDLQVWDPVKSAFPGMVRVARYYGGYGRVVVVRHYNGLETIYAHLHRFKVKPGDFVKAGDVVGLGGSSGHSTGSHLHFEVRFKGVPLNPHTFIDFGSEQVENDVLVLKKTQFGYAAFPAGTHFHKVKRGDFLYKIAKQYGTSVSEICRMNGISRNQTLYVGQKIRVI